MDERTPLEIYMEGNIVFRQGERVIYADRMYYNVPNHTGTILNAEMLTPVKNYEGLLRLKSDDAPADRPRQLLCPKHVRHLKPDGRAELSAAGGRHLL